MLLDHRAGIELLRLALEDADSPYADLLRAVTSSLPPLAGDEREAVHRLAVQGPPTEEVGLAPFARDGHRLLAVARRSGDVAEVLPSCGPAMLRGLALASGLAVIGPEGASAGDPVTYLPLPGRRHL